MYAKNRQDLSAEKTERTGRFMQNTRTQIHFRDSLFVGKISINPCCSAGKETKKTARERQHFREQRMVVGGGGGN